MNSLLSHRFIFISVPISKGSALGKLLHSLAPNEISLFLLIQTESLGASLLWEQPRSEKWQLIFTKTVMWEPTIWTWGCNSTWLNSLFAVERCKQLLQSWHPCFSAIADFLCANLLVQHCGVPIAGGLHQQRWSFCYQNPSNLHI